jgi:hypothetical protein
MSAIKMSRRERTSLARIAARPCLASDIPADHAAKFIGYGLVKRDVMLLYATALGQVELLRQRFRDIDLTAA